MKSGRLWLLLIDCFLVIVVSHAFIGCVRSGNPNEQCHAEYSSKLWLATSSSDLKKNTTRSLSKRKYPKNSVVSRLKQAAILANRKAKEQESSEPAISAVAPPRKLGNLRQLTAAIDSHLEESSRIGFDRRQASPPARDSMTALIFHNDQMTVETNPAWIETKIAIVFCKPLIEDQITLEQRERVGRLIRAIKYEEYRPDTICFLGSKGCMRAQEYFLECAPQDLISGVRFMLEPTLVADGAVQKVAGRLQQKYLKKVLQNQRRVRLHIKFALVSSDYHLCVLNDIHVRSPGQSNLQALKGWDTSNQYSPTPLLVELSWTYLYAPTLSLTYSDEPTEMFIASSYRRAQSLLPVLQNLRGVVRNAEFFQRENYRVLVQVRRTFVADVERLYRQQPSLRQVHAIRTPYRDMPLDVVLEFTVVSLGRCTDLVRPSGLLTGSVPRSDFDMALSLLEQTINQLVVACDQDRP